MIGREIASERHYLGRSLKKIMVEYPIGCGVKTKEVDRFAKNLYKRMTENRSTVAFNTLKLTYQWRETVDFLKYHNLEHYVNEIINYHNGYLSKIKVNHD